MARKRVATVSKWELRMWDVTGVPKFLLSEFVDLEMVEDGYCLRCKLRCWSGEEATVFRAMLYEMKDIEIHWYVWPNVDLYDQENCIIRLSGCSLKKLHERDEEIYAQFIGRLELPDGSEVEKVLKEI